MASSGEGLALWLSHGASVGHVRVYLLRVVQADPHRQVPLVAPYVLRDGFGFLEVLYRRQVGSVSKGLTLELWARRSHGDASRFKSTALARATQWGLSQPHRLWKSSSKPHRRRPGLPVTKGGDKCRVSENEAAPGRGPGCRVRGSAWGPGVASH